jgi:hypothetical protein
MVIKGNDISINVAGHGGVWGCETSMLAHSLESRLIDGGEIRLKRRQACFLSEAKFAPMP